MATKKKNTRTVLDEAIGAYYQKYYGDTFRADGYSLIISGEDMAGDGNDTKYLIVGAPMQTKHAGIGLATILLDWVKAKK